MFKKIFNPKRKRQEPPGRHNTNKITFDPASAAILNRHFSPLSSRAMSPSDVLDIVGYPLIQNNDYSSFLSPLSPKTPFKAMQEVASPPQSYRLTIQNNTTPSPLPNQQSILLLETSREDKTLVEKESNQGLEEEQDTTSIEIYRLQQKLLKLEQEKEAWDFKLQGYIEREEQMRELINQLHIQRPVRHNSYKSASTRSSAYLTEEDEDEDQEEQVLIHDEDPYNYYRNYYVPKYYYYDYYYARPSRHSYYY